MIAAGFNRAQWGYAVLVVVGLAAPFYVYPVFAMNVLCLALFASAFNLLLGYSGLLSFGHAAFLETWWRVCRSEVERGLLVDGHADDLPQPHFRLVPVVGRGSMDWFLP